MALKDLLQNNAPDPTQPGLQPPLQPAPQAGGLKSLLIQDGQEQTPRLTTGTGPDERSGVVKVLDFIDELATGGLISDTLTGREKPSTGQLLGQLAQTGLTVASFIPGAAFATAPAKVALAAKTASKVPTVAKLFQGASFGQKVARGAGLGAAFAGSAGLAEEGTVGGALRGAVSGVVLGAALPIVGIGFSRLGTKVIPAARASQFGKLIETQVIVPAKITIAGARKGKLSRKIFPGTKGGREFVERVEDARVFIQQTEAKGNALLNKTVKILDKKGTEAQKDLFFNIGESNAILGSKSLTSSELLAAQNISDDLVANSIRGGFGVTKDVSNVFIQTGKKFGKKLPKKAGFFIPRDYSNVKVASLADTAAAEVTQAVTKAGDKVSSKILNKLLSKQTSKLKGLADYYAKNHPRISKIADEKIRLEEAFTLARKVRDSRIAIGAPGFRRTTAFTSRQEYLDAGGNPNFTEAYARWLTRNAPDASFRFSFARGEMLKDAASSKTLNRIKSSVRGEVTENFGGADAEEAVKIIDSIVDLTYGSPQKGADIAALLKRVQLPKLSLAAISNSTQPVNGLLVGTFKNFAKSFFKAMTKEGEEIAVNSGATVQRVLEDTTKFGKLVNFLLKPFKLGEAWNRRWAANQGYLEVYDLAKAGKFDIVEEFIGRKVTSADQIVKADLLRGANVFSNKIHFSSEPIDMPLFFSSPTGRVAFQFKNFIYNQTRFVLEQTAGEFAAGNLGRGARNLAILMSVFPVAGNTILAIRNTITGKETDKDATLVDRWLQGIAAVGGFGIFEDLIRSAQFGGSLEFLAGPTASTFAKGLNITAGSGGKPAASVARDIAKFGAGFIGPAGTAITNRALPR